MSRGSGSTFLKRQKEAARQQKQRDKIERRKQRKLDKENGIVTPDSDLGEAFALDEQTTEDENLSDTSTDAVEDAV